MEQFETLFCVIGAIEEGDPGGGEATSKNRTA
jgi:hypothetical protein